MKKQKSEQLIKEMVNEIMKNQSGRFPKIPCEIHPRTWIADDPTEWLLPPIVESNNQEEQE